jgi:hypothetical protein
MTGVRRETGVLARDNRMLIHDAMRSSVCPGAGITVHWGLGNRWPWVSPPRQMTRGLRT